MYIFILWCVIWKKVQCTDMFCTLKRKINSVWNQNYRMRITCLVPNMSLYCTFLIAPSAFSKVYFKYIIAKIPRYACKWTTLLILYNKVKVKGHIIVSRVLLSLWLINLYMVPLSYSYGYQYLFRISLL